MHVGAVGRDNLQLRARTDEGPGELFCFDRLMSYFKTRLGGALMQTDHGSCSWGGATGCGGQRCFPLACRVVEAQPEGSPPMTAIMNLRSLIEKSADHDLLQDRCWGEAGGSGGRNKDGRGPWREV